MIYEFEKPVDPVTLLEDIIKNLVSEPDAVDIFTTKGAGSTTILSIDVIPDDRGKIIGRGGCIIESLKVLFNAIGCKRGQAIILEINE